MEEVLGIYSELYGFRSDQGSDDSAVDRALSLGRDTTIPAPVRCELEGLARHRMVRVADRRSSVKARLQIEVGLAEKYPKQESPYEGMAAIAEMLEGDDDSLRTAQRLRGDLLAPDWIRDRAEEVYARSRLIGLSFSSIGEGLDLSGVQTEGSPGFLLYTWSAATPEDLPGLLAGVESLSGAFPDAVVIGLPLGEAEPFDAITATIELPGHGLDPRSASTPDLAKRLHADLPGLLYRFDEYGILREVRSIR